MPKIDVSLSDLNELIGRRLTLNELQEAMMYAKGEVEAAEGDTVKLEIKDSNRPDLWSAEGVAREIQGRYTTKRGLPKYVVKKGKIVVKVDAKMKNVRPYTVCAVARNLKIDKDVLSQMIQLQEKVATTFGRNRKEVAIGYYDLDKIKPPIRFTIVKPDGIKFVPLDFDREMTPKEILEMHPKGKEFAHLLKGMNEYPMFIDANDNVLSIPPIINSDISGRVTEKTKNLYIEASGFNMKFLVPAVNVLVAALADRGATIESVTVKYPDKTLVTPDLSPKKAFVDVDYVNKVAGMKLTAKEIVELLKKARYDAIVKEKGKRIEVLYPCYRQDIMHQADIAEDVIVSYGYNKIEPVMPKLATIGGNDLREVMSNKVAKVMVGLGMQEILSYILTSKANLFKKMNVKETPVVEIENAVSENWSIFRSSILPNLLEFLSVNQHVEYPQRIFEIGDVTLLDEKKETKTRDVRKLADAITDTKISYEEISSLLDALLTSFGIKYVLRKISHPSFIEGRVAEIVVDNKSIGLVGEVSPEVLKNWQMEMPVACFEVSLEIF
jgi:phenylalanyl-tRNA synthetase beta chain